MDTRLLPTLGDPVEAPRVGPGTREASGREGTGQSLLCRATRSIQEITISSLQTVERPTGIIG